MVRPMSHFHARTVTHLLEEQRYILTSLFVTYRKSFREEMVLVCIGILPLKEYPISPLKGDDLILKSGDSGISPYERSSCLYPVVIFGCFKRSRSPRFICLFLNVLGEVSFSSDLNKFPLHFVPV